MEMEETTGMNVEMEETTGMSTGQREIADVSFVDGNLNYLVIFWLSVRQLST